MKNRDVRNLLDTMQDNGELPCINIHILRAIGPTLLNRDFNNQIKKLVFGGKTRVRFSSQSVMKAIRTWRSERGNIGNQSVHSRYLPEHLSRIIASKDEKYAELATQVKTTLSKGKELGKLDTIVVYTKNDIDAMAEIIIRHYDENPEKLLKDMQGNKKEKEQKNLWTDVVKELQISASERGLDDMTALKGRMATDNTFGDTIESAVSVNHAYSVDEWQGDTDFFAATDDTKAMLSFITGENESVTGGAAMLDLTDIAANVFYQYANIDTRTLLQNVLRGIDLENKEEVDYAVKRMKRIAAEFIQDFAMFTPEAKQHSMASTPEPICMAITSSKYGRPLSADKEFVRLVVPCGDKSTDRIARSRLVNFINNAQEGAFAIDDYSNILWLENTPEDLELPKNATKVTLREVEKYLFG